MQQSLELVADVVLDLVPLYPGTRGSVPGTITLTSTGRIEFTDATLQSDIDFLNVETLSLLRDKNNPDPYTIYMVPDSEIGLKITMTSRPNSKGSLYCGIPAKTFLENNGIQFPDKVSFEIVNYNGGQIIKLKCREADPNDFEYEPAPQAKASPARTPIPPAKKKVIPHKNIDPETGKRPYNRKPPKGQHGGFRVKGQKNGVLPPAPGKQKKR